METLISSFTHNLLVKIEQLEEQLDRIAVYQKKQHHLRNSKLGLPKQLREIIDELYGFNASMIELKQQFQLAVDDDRINKLEAEVGIETVEVLLNTLPNVTKIFSNPDNIELFEAYHGFIGLFTKIMKEARVITQIRSHMEHGKQSIDHFQGYYIDVDVYLQVLENIEKYTTILRSSNSQSLFETCLSESFSILGDLQEGVVYTQDHLQIQVFNKLITYLKQFMDNLATYKKYEEFPITLDEVRNAFTNLLDHDDMRNKGEVKIRSIFKNQSDYLTISKFFDQFK